MSKKKTKPEDDGPITVDIRECKPNPMWTEEQTSWIRFLVYSRKVPCAECGKKARVMWTMLCEFRAVILRPGHFVVRASHLPLTPVCGDHPLSPAFKKEEAPEKATAEVLRTRAGGGM